MYLERKSFLWFDRGNLHSPTLLTHPHTQHTPTHPHTQHTHTHTHTHTQHRVVIRGEQADSAVLCTERETYDLRAADTSNAFLLVPSLSYTPDTCNSVPLSLYTNPHTFLPSTYYTASERSLDLTIHSKQVCRM